MWLIPHIVQNDWNPFTVLFQSLLSMLIGSPISKAVRWTEIYLVLWEIEKQTWHLSSQLCETKVHLQQNQGFLFFFFLQPRENRLCFLWEVLRGTCTSSFTFWSYKQDQTTSCKALNTLKEKNSYHLSQGVPQAEGESWPACFPPVTI